MIFLALTLMGCTDISCENDFGERACDISARNQHNDVWSLYEQEDGKTSFILDFSVMTCTPCQEAAVYVQEFAAEYPNIEYVTILMRDGIGEDPSVSDAQLWAEAFSTNEPILVGGEYLIGIDDDQWDLHSWPTFFSLCPDLVVLDRMIGFGEEGLVDFFEVTNELCITY